MFELAYSSVSRSDNDDVLDILEVARDFNAKNDITGCLLYHKGQFTQILEGNKEVVKALFSRIEQDKRHYDVKLLYESEKDDRVFSQWSMAFQHVDGSFLDQVNNELFEENLLLFSELTKRPSPAVKLFWKKVRQIIKI